MERFLALPREKQERIIEAGFLCLGKMGYKKASAQDIADSAGISKGMIFHYFGSKKGMYRYLLQLALGEVIAAFQTGFDPSVTDFFDRMLMFSNCKISCLTKHPSLLAFLASDYTEAEPEVVDLTREFLEQGSKIRMDSLMSVEDQHRFKKPEYAELTKNLLMNYGEKYVQSAASMKIEQLVEYQKEFEACLVMLKENLYKEEFIK